MLDELTAPVDKTRRWFEQGACFAKGTLVQTKEGLKPIEQIQVGDWVLSKPENGGEQAYKRVLKTFAHEPQRVVELCYYKPTNKPSQRPGNVARITVTVNHPVWTKERGWTAVDGLRSIEDSLPHFEDRDGDDVKFSYIKNIYLSDQPSVGWLSNNWPENVSVNKGSLWDYAEHRLVASSEFPPDDIAEGERPDPYFKAPVYNLEVEDFHTYYVGEHGIWVHNQNCDGWNLEVRNTIHPVKFINQVSAFTTRTELKNVLAARGADNGIYLLRAHSNSQLQELVDADKRIANWLKHEEAVPGRLVSKNTGERYEYAGVYMSREGKLDALAIEGAEQLGQTVNLIDRKLILVKAGRYDEVMDSFNRVAQFLDQNPGTTLTFEFNPGIIKEELVHLTRAKQMLDDIRNGSTNPLLQIKKTVVNEFGELEDVIDTAAMDLLRRMIAEGRILARNAAERTPLSQMVLDEGPGLSVSELAPAHIYLQLAQARQYWLDQGASLSRLNQARFVVADLPTGWAARTEGTTVTLDTSGAGWGWFVDASPQDNAEFVPLNPAASPRAAAVGDWRAAPGSAAEGKLDLLTVLIHELGHVLGLPMPQSADGSAPGEGAHAMSQYLNPGQRRLPDAVDIAALQAAGPDAYLGNAQVVFTAFGAGVVGTTVPSAPGYESPWTAQQNQGLTQGFDAALAAAQGRWSTSGQVALQGAAATLHENQTSQTRLNQVFVVNDTDRVLSFRLSQTGSLSTQDALTWLADASASLKAMVNPKAGWWEQATQAVQLKNGFMESARNAMADAHAALQLSMTVPTRTFDEFLVMANKKGLFGNAAHKDVMTQAELEMKARLDLSQMKNIGCFVAGTLVHTREGLKPIEQIQVGDWVLSKPESGEGEQAYKRVTKTVSFEEKEVWTISYFDKTDGDIRFINRQSIDDLRRRLVATPNHPFFVVGKGWTALRDVGIYDHLLLESGEIAVVYQVMNLYKFESADSLAYAGTGLGMNEGYLIDFSGESDVECCFPTDREPEPVEIDFENSATYFYATVYNFEVEDFHTYYVGTKGVWVHNTNCAENVGGTAQAIRDGLIPQNGTGLYFTQGEARGLGGKNRGVILVGEFPSDPALPWAEFQAREEGAQLIINQDKVNGFATFTYRFDNVGPDGAAKGLNFIRAGDGRALLSDGRWSMTTIDSKDGLKNLPKTV